MLKWFYTQKASNRPRTCRSQKMVQMYTVHCAVNSVSSCWEDHYDFGMPRAVKSVLVIAGALNVDGLVLIGTKMLSWFVHSVIVICLNFWLTTQFCLSFVWVEGRIFLFRLMYLCPKIGHFKWSLSWIMDFSQVPESRRVIWSKKWFSCTKRWLLDGV